VKGDSLDCDLKLDSQLKEEDSAASKHPDGSNPNNPAVDVNKNLHRNSDYIEGETISEITCSSSSDIRVLSVVQSPSGGCIVTYEKQGQLFELANAKHQMSHCSRVALSVKKNLEEAGFECESSILRR